MLTALPPLQKPASVRPDPICSAAPAGDQGSVADGFLPRGFFATVRDRFIEAVDGGRAERVHRTE